LQLRDPPITRVVAHGFQSLTVKVAKRSFAPLPPGGDCMATAPHLPPFGARCGAVALAVGNDQGQDVFHVPGRPSCPMIVTVKHPWQISSPESRAPSPGAANRCFRFRGGAVRSMSVGGSAHGVIVLPITSRIKKATKPQKAGVGGAVRHVGVPSVRYALPGRGLRLPACPGARPAPSRGYSVAVRAGLVPNLAKCKVQGAILYCRPRLQWINDQISSNNRVADFSLLPGSHSDRPCRCHAAQPGSL
jgi:hypothetical protein